MRRQMVSCLAAAAVASLVPRLARADYVITPYGIIVEGTVTVHPGSPPQVTVRHRKFGPLNFRLKETERIEVPTNEELYAKRLAQAKREGPDAVFAAGQWALRRGLMKQFYEAVDMTLKAKPDHEAAKQVVELRKILDEEIPDPKADLEALFKLLKEKLPNQKMKTKTSKHFVLVYDTPEERAKERLELLERVCESFMMFFVSSGIDLHKPRERMPVVLFDRYDDFKTFAVSLSEELEHAAGFYDPERNVSFFFGHGTYPVFKKLQEAEEELGREVADARRRYGASAVRELIGLQKTLHVLFNVAQENQDIEVVSHEATHQMAYNAGLFPRGVRVPKWVNEGLATFFETPNDAAWGGIGAVNDLRLEWYRALAEHDREHSSIDFVVGDEIFTYAGSLGSLIHAYGQAWALTHFLANNHFHELTTYYRLVSQLPPDMIISPQILRRCFDQAFGTNRAALDTRWRSHMSSLPTEMEVIRKYRSR